MNQAVLNKYNIYFEKTENGRKFPDGKTALSSYLYIWLHIDDIDDFLADIDLCLSGKFDQVIDRYYHASLIGTYGELTPDTIILSAEDGTNAQSTPLADFKEILLSWREFLTLP